MAISVGVALCVAYIAGLLLTGLFPDGVRWGSLFFPWAALIFAGGTLVFALLAPRSWKLGLSLRRWVWIAGVGCLATVYLTWRSPLPPPQDISVYVERAQAISPSHIIVGRAIEDPHLNRGLKGRFRLAVEQLKVEDAAGETTFQIPARGQVYVTAPLPQVTGLHTGQWVTAKGWLYLPQGAMNPNGFDFRAYLASRNTFAGLAASELKFPETATWGLWRVRQRVVRTQVRALGSPLGQIVSAMALGRKAVDLPFDIQDLFSQVGLAHTIAASGFHVSLLLGTVLALVRSRSGRVKLVIGLIVLAGYVTLTGLQASVVRAALMGSAALLGLCLERQVKPLGALLVAVTLMLIGNPNWIWDIGFQLSVSATVGLIVMVPPLTRWLDWLPVTLAGFIAVPIAATLWTLPLTLYHFNVISGVSIPLNVIATPLVTVISLGGMGSSALALLAPPLGQWVANVLYYPTQGLFGLARLSSQLPGNAIAIGQISLWQLIGLYGILGLGIMPVRFVLVKRIIPVAFLGLILVPMGWQLLTQNQITVLAAGGELVWVMQDHGRTTLVNSGSEKTAFYTVQPFLRQGGVNRLESAIALPFDQDFPAGWQSLLRQTPSYNLYGIAETSPLPDSGDRYHPLPVGQSTALHHLTLQPLGTENPILRLTTPEQSWLLLPQLSLMLQDYLAGAGSVLQSDVLVWPGQELSEKLLAAVQPEVTISYGHALPEFVERFLQKAQIQTFWTERDGAVTWRDRDGFHSYLETKHRNGLPWG